MPPANPFAAPDRLTRLQIEITTGCNLRCAGCQRSIAMQAGRWHNGHMPPARLRAILANAPPADAVILQGIGEPTLHPDLPRCVALARDTGKFRAVSFNTNALVRDLGYYADLRQAGLNHLSVSVDSLDPAVAQACRAGTDTVLLERMLAGLLALFGPATTLSVVLSRDNAAGLPGLLRRLHVLGGRVVEIQPLIAYGPAADRRCLDPADIGAAGRSIAAAAAALPGLQVLLAPAMMPNGMRCRRPLHAAYVTLDGRLTPCCTTDDTALFGGASLAEAPFEQLWQHPGVAAWLSGYLEREPELCRRCAFNPAGAAAAPGGMRPQGESLLRAGRLDAAEAAFKVALAGEDAAASLHGMGLVLMQRGRHAEAEPWLRIAAALQPDARCRHNLSLCLHSLGRTEAAIAAERAAIAADGNYIPAQRGLADRLLEQGARHEAVGLLTALGERAANGDQLALAEWVVQRLLPLRQNAAAMLRLADVLRSAGREDLAQSLAAALLRDEPLDVAAQLAMTMSQLAVVHASDAEIAARRQAYAVNLLRLEASAAAAPAPLLQAAAERIGNTKPFFLAYQGEDDVALQCAYGRVLMRIAHGGATPPALPVATPQGKLRVGFASSYFHLHSVSKLFGGWMQQLDPARFEVYGYQFGTASDATGQALAAACTAYRQGDASDARWREVIRADRLHALIYPEIGMHPLPIRLACHRLAPVQCAAWGHPVTTGLPEIDYFLSSELMEPPGAEAQYSERLIRLPNLSVWYEKLPDYPGSLSRDELGVGADDVVYLCCQSIFKYLPRHDVVFPRIAAQVPAARFVFIGFREAPTAVFRDRLTRCFAEHGMQAEPHVRIIAPVPHQRFPALLRGCDVYLDSIGWSGGNTTLEALACGLPVVTTPTGLMRGRHSAAILRHIGLGARVCASRDAYVALAVLLAQPEQRAQYAAQVRQAEPRLYRDPMPVRALEAFLLRAVAAAGAPAELEARR